MLEYLNKKDSEKAATEEQKKALLKQQTEASVKESHADKMRQEQLKREKDKLDRERFRDNVFTYIFNILFLFKSFFIFLAHITYDND